MKIHTNFLRSPKEARFPARALSNPKKSLLLVLWGGNVKTNRSVSRQRGRNRQHATNFFNLFEQMADSSWNKVCRPCRLKHASCDGCPLLSSSHFLPRSVLFSFHEVRLTPCGHARAPCGVQSTRQRPCQRCVRSRQERQCVSVRKNKRGRPPNRKKRRIFDPADEDGGSSHDSDNTVPNSSPIIGAAYQGEGDQPMVSQPHPPSPPPRQGNFGQKEEVMRPPPHSPAPWGSETHACGGAHQGHGHTQLGFLWQGVSELRAANRDMLATLKELDSRVRRLDQSIDRLHQLLRLRHRHHQDAAAPRRSPPATRADASPERDKWNTPADDHQSPTTNGSSNATTFWCERATPPEMMNWFQDCEYLSL